MFKNLCPALLGVSGRESEIIELTLSHGFKGLDLDLGAFAEQVASQGLARASRLLTSARLKLGSFVLPPGWREDAAEYAAGLKQLSSLAEIARQVGCPRATTLVEPGSDTRPYHENFEVHRRRLAEMGDLLRGFGIR